MIDTNLVAGLLIGFGLYPVVEEIASVVRRVRSLNREVRNIAKPREASTMGTLLEQERINRRLREPVPSWHDPLPPPEEMAYEAAVRWSGWFDWEYKRLTEEFDRKLKNNPNMTLAEFDPKARVR